MPMTLRSTIARLDEMGVEPFMVSAALIGIVSQRLMRRVCTTCREAYRPDERELGRFGPDGRCGKRCDLLQGPSP